MERRFPRDIGSLEAVFTFVAEFAAAHAIDQDACFDADLIVEELFTNMVKYSRDGAQDIAIALGRAPGRLTIVLRDFDVEAFDITQMPDFDTTTPLERRRAGGLGIHLVKQIAETLRYDYADRNSTITVTRRLES